MNNKVLPIVYVSTPITGAWGKDASICYIMDNILRAIHFVNQLRIYYPEVKYYCPAENDLAIQYLYQNKDVLGKAILKADKCIIEDYCSGLIAYKWERSDGIDIEIRFAKKLNLPCLEIDKILSDNQIKYFVGNNAKGIWIDKFIGNVQKGFEINPKELAILWNRFFRY